MPQPPAQAADAARHERDAWLRALALTADLERRPERTWPQLIQEQAERCGDAPAVLGDAGCWTYRELASRAWQFARWARSQGLQAGECVGLMLPNHPDLLAAWIGLIRLGLVAALIPPDLRGPGLAHALTQARAVRLVATAGAREAVQDAGPRLSAPLPCDWLRAAGEADAAAPPGAVWLDDRLAGVGSAALSADEAAWPRLPDPALLIYTSGTTGFPKAARVSHRRVMQWSLWFAGLLQTDATDRLYNVLPMHHSVGGVVAPGCVLATGGSLVLRDGFSARAFWSDVRRWDCTLVQTIGDLCRILLAQPEDPLERQHRVRASSGNGLSADIWMPWVQRFGIPRVLEFYAATEAPFSLYNLTGQPGVVGHVPRFLERHLPVTLVRIDPVEQEPLRDERGFCLRCGPDEPGEALCRLDAPGTSGAVRFDGYTGAEETQRKILRDVFEPGDTWYRSGDLLSRDGSGHYRFVDRIGDTFRWKGENVSCQEVLAVLGRAPGVRDAVVFGVLVPGHPGRAGMAALVCDGDEAIATLPAQLRAELPEHAWPVFVRCCPSLSRTATFKPMRQRLVQEGFDPQGVADPLWVLDRASAAYVPLTAERHARIAAGRWRF